MTETSFQQTRDSIGSEPESFPIALKFFRNLKAHHTIKTTKSNIAGGAIYGHPIYGVYGSAEYTSINKSGFILGHGTYGILGTSLIGVNDLIETIISVKNYNNVYYDLIDTQDFIDSSNSTGTFGSASYDYTLTSGEQLQSDIIAANNQGYTKAILLITGTSILDDTLYLSADGGSNWEIVTNETQHTFTNTSTDGIKYKIVGGATTSTITSIKVTYS